MRNKLSKKELEKKSEEVRSLIRGAIKGTIKIPYDSLIFLDSDSLIEVFTKKRIELLQYINKYKPKTLQTLANLAGRKKQAVSRDLRILERHELVKLEKKGRSISPKIKKIFLVYELTGLA